MPQRDDDLVVLTSASSEVQAGLFRSVLDSHGIDSVGPNTAATTLRWEISSTDPYRVYVRRSDLARAREALSRERADSVDIDWEAVDVGDPAPEEVDRAPRRVRLLPLVIGWLALAFLVLAIVMLGWNSMNP